MSTIACLPYIGETPSSSSAVPRRTRRRTTTSVSRWVVTSRLRWRPAAVSGGGARSVRVRGRAGQVSKLPARLPEPRMSRLLHLQPVDLHAQSHHQQPASGPLTLDLLANDTFVSVVPPFHRPRTLSEARRTMILSRPGLGRPSRRGPGRTAPQTRASASGSRSRSSGPWPRTIRVSSRSRPPRLPNAQPPLAAHSPAGGSA